MKTLIVVLLGFLFAFNAAAADDEAAATATVLTEVLQRAMQENNVALDAQLLLKKQDVDTSWRLVDIFLSPHGLRFGGWAGGRTFKDATVFQGGGMLGWRYTHAPLDNASFDVYLGAQEGNHFIFEPSVDFLIIRRPVRALFLEFTSGLNTHIGYRFTHPMNDTNNTGRDEHAIVLGISAGIVTHR